MKINWERELSSIDSLVGTYIFGSGKALRDMLGTVLKHRIGNIWDKLDPNRQKYAKD